MIPDSLVKAGGVRVLVFFNNGDNKSDQLGPEVQILDARALLLWRNLSFFVLHRKNSFEALHVLL